MTHACDRLVEQKHVGVLHQQHSDLEPLLLTVRENSRGLVALGRQTDGLEGLLDLREHRSSTSQHRQHGPTGTGGDVQVLQYRQILEDAGGLEGSADAEAGDLMYLLAEQFHAGLRHRAGGRDEAGDGIDQRGLAGTVGPDEEAEIALHQRQIDVGVGLETVETDCQVSYFEVLTRHAGVAAERGMRTFDMNHRVSSFSGSSLDSGTGSDSFLRLRSANSPAIPAGKNPTTTTNSRPCAYVQPDGNCSDSVV